MNASASVSDEVELEDDLEAAVEVVPFFCFEALDPFPFSALRLVPLLVVSVAVDDDIVLCTNFSSAN